MSNRKRLLILELQNLLEAPDKSVLVSEVIEAELRAAACLRRALGASAAPLIPVDVVERFRELQEITKEAGPAWRARVDALLQNAHEGPNKADPAALAMLRPMVLGNDAHPWR